tara:strand:- start:62 stop:784 length:723 start_codon:yes stop_codon:yes gene_type:complete
MEDKNRRKRYELKASKLVFARQKLEYHGKVHLVAMEEFSNSFTRFIKMLEESDQKIRLQRMMGLKPPEEEEEIKINLSKAGQKAKEQKNKKKNKEQKKQEKQEEPPKQDTPEQPHKPKEPLPDDYKQLYRKVALNTHPDRLSHLPVEEQEKKNKILLEVNDAIRQKEYWKIVESAMVLGIDIPDQLRFDTALLEKKITEYEEQVKKIQKSVAWEWYNLEDDKSKQDLVTRYASFLLTNFK